MSITSSMEIAKSALTVNQAALTIVSNNISNMDTAGYSKLKVNQTGVVNYASTAITSAIVQANALSGVAISSIQRYSNAYLEKYYNSENSEYSYYKEYSTLANNVESLVNELKDTGLSDALSSFYTAANTLNGSPNDITARNAYVSAAENVCSVFNSMYGNLSDIKTSLVGDGSSTGSLQSSEISGEVDELNSLFDKLAVINGSIVKAGTDDDTSAAASSLLDERDSILTEISSYIPVNTEINRNGTANVSLGSYTLVKSSSVQRYLSVETTGSSSNPVAVNLVNKDDPTKTVDVTDLVDRGSIGAIIDISGSDANNLTINSVLSSLNSMANAFATTLNDIQTKTGTTTSTTGATIATTPMAMDKDTLKLITSTTAMFSASNGGTTITAENISVNKAIINNAYLVAAARVTDTTATSNTGNNTNIGLVINARNNTTALGGSTLENYLADFVSSVGTKTSIISTTLSTQSTVLSQIKTQLSSATGVNLDEELTDLIKYQRAYEAAGRVFTTCNDLLEQLVNLGR